MRKAARQVSIATNMTAAAAFLGFAGAVLAACQSAPSGPGAISSASKSAALRTMEGIATRAHRCWFASNDPAFRDYSFANELNSFSGRPRFLLVPKGNYGGKPLLVVQAEGEPARVDAFGPLMDQPAGNRISDDLKRWIDGSDSCSRTA